MPGPRAANRLLAPALLIGASCALSALAILRDPLVDADSVRTLVAATSIAQLHSAPWPLHALLIALLQGLSGLSMQASAQLLDTALFALLALGFARLVTLVGAERRSYGWAALVLLLFPQLNYWRGQVLDETGMWAFLVSGLVALAHYQRAQRWVDAFVFALCCAVAVLFRLEALVFALLLPLACLQRSSPSPLGAVLRLYAALGTVTLVPLLAAARLGGLATLADHVLPSLIGLGPEVSNGFTAAVSNYAGQVLGAPSADFAPFALGAGLLVVLLLAFAETLGLVYVALLGWAGATRRTLLPDNDSRALVLLLFAGGLLIALALLAREQAIESRALMPLCLAMLIPATFATRELVRAASDSRRPLAALCGLAALVAMLLADGLLSFGTRTSYVSESIAWMDANLPPDARVFSNDRQLAWYSGRQVDWTAVERGDAAIIARSAPLADVDYWVLRLDGGDRRLEVALSAYADVLEPVARFAGSGNQRIVLLRRASSAIAGRSAI